MKISIEEVSQIQEEEIIIKCHEVNNGILNLIQSIKIQGGMLIGYEGSNIHRLHIKDVYYFESVDNKTFMYCKDKVFESRQKLYELEQLGQNASFFRASKSTIINAARISYISPSLSGRFEARLDNGEKLMISRQFVPMLKKMLNL